MSKRLVDDLVKALDMTGISCMKWTRSVETGARSRGCARRSASHGARKILRLRQTGSGNTAPAGPRFFPPIYFSCKTLKTQVKVFDPSVTPSAKSRTLTPLLSETEADVARELLIDRLPSLMSFVSCHDERIEPQRSAACRCTTRWFRLCATRVRPSALAAYVQ